MILITCSRIVYGWLHCLRSQYVSSFIQNRYLSKIWSKHCTGMNNLLNRGMKIQTIRAWGWFIQLLGSNALKNRNLINDMLKIPQHTFSDHDPQVQMLPRYSKLLIIVFHTQGWVCISSCCWLLYGIHLRNLCTDMVGHFFKYFNFCGALLGSNKSYMPSYFMTYVIKHGIDSNKSRTDKVAIILFFFFLGE